MNLFAGYGRILHHIVQVQVVLVLGVAESREHSTGQAFLNEKLNQDPHVSLAPASYSSDQRHAYPAPVTKKASDRTKNSSDSIHVIMLIYTLSIYVCVDSNTTLVFQGKDN